jgi:hypothetical protein
MTYVYTVLYKVESMEEPGEQCTVVLALIVTEPAWADIQRLGSILAWIVILSVYGADTIAEVKLSISPFMR